MERALGHLGKDLRHGVDPIVGFEFRNFENISSVSQELSSEEFVNKEDLADDVDEGEELAEEVLDRVGGVGAVELVEVVDNVLDLTLL